MKVAAWHVGLSAARKRPSRIKFAAPRTSSPTYRGGCRNNTPPGVAFRVSHIAYSSAQRKGASLAVSVDRFGLGNLFLHIYLGDGVGLFKCWELKLFIKFWKLFTEYLWVHSGKRFEAVSFYL